MQVVGISALAVGWFAAKRGTGVVANYVQARLGQPSLVRETSRMSPLEIIKHPIKKTRQFMQRSQDPLKGVVLNVRSSIECIYMLTSSVCFQPSLETRLRDIAITTSNIKSNNGLFRNVLFYGPPGTGESS